MPQCTNPTTSPRAAIYIRVSTSKQEDEGTSLDTQEARCRALCAERGWQIVSVFSDTFTGTKYRERPGLTGLRQRVRAGEIDVVLAYALDRLSRNQAHLAIVAEEIEDHGARLVFVTEDFEDSAVGKFIRSAKSFAAEVEREKIVERTTRGRLARVEAGKLIPGRTPLFGYRWATPNDFAPDDPRRAVAADPHAVLVIHPETGVIVRRIFAEALAGKTLRGIAAGLNADGIPSPRGARWGSSTVHHVLYNRNYTGEAAAFGWRARGSRTKRFDRSTAVELPDGTIPALTDRATYETVAAQLVRNKAESIRNAADPEAGLLRAGYAFCGLCGRAMRVKTSKRQTPVYLCTGADDPARPCRGHGIATRILDGPVWLGVRERLQDGDVIARELARLRRDDPTRTEQSELDRRARELAATERNLVNSLGKTDNDRVVALIMADLDALTKQRHAVETELADLARQRQEWKHAEARLAALDLWRRSVAAHLDDIEGEEDYATKRDALATCNARVKVWPVDHAPRWEATMELGGELVRINDLQYRTTCTSGQKVVVLRWNNLDVEARSCAAD